MPECDHCRKESPLPFDCPYCGGSYCSDHRLPPTHNCIGEEAWRKRRSGPAPGAGPGGEDPARPRKECFYCGVITPKTFSCPVCGHDFCSFHKDHADHPAAGPERTTGRPVYTSPPVQGEPPKKPLDPKIIALFLLIFALVTGAVLAIGIFQGPPATQAPDVAPAAAVQQALTTPLPAASLAATALPAGPAGGRPPTGTVVSGNILPGGYGELWADNREGESDAVVVLTHTGGNNSLLSVYVRSGENCTVKNIPNGMYTVYIQYGEDWNATGRRFEKDQRYTRFEDEFSYTSLTTSHKTLTQKITETRYSIYNITLFRVTSGTARTTGVAKDQFPHL